MSDWPEIPYARWAPTGASLHMWAQIVGKFRLAHTPWINHSWQAAFYVTARGLTTSPVPAGAGAVEARFDFIDHVLRIDGSDGGTEHVPLAPMSVADFQARFKEALGRLGAPADFHGTPNEVADPVPFARQTAPGAYDPEATLMAFLQSTYDAAADAAGWDRARLDCVTGRPRVPRPLD